MLIRLFFQSKAAHFFPVCQNFSSVKMSSDSVAMRFSINARLVVLFTLSDDAFRQAMKLCRRI